MGGADAGPAVLDGLVGDTELSQVVSDHLRLKAKHAHLVQSSHHQTSQSYAQLVQFLKYIQSTGYLGDHIWQATVNFILV